MSLVENPSPLAKKLIVFSAFHKDYPYANYSNWIRPISLGTFKFNNDYCLSDDMGINISHHHPFYSELTSQFCAWKNLGPYDYIGFCQYRRYFHFLNDSFACHNKIFLDPTPETFAFISSDQQYQAALSILSFADMIVPRPMNLGVSITDQYLACKPSIHWTLLIDSIREIFPEYGYLLKWFEHERLLTVCNMYVMKPEILNQYFTQLFRLTEYMRPKLTLPPNQPDHRYLGYLAERFLSLYLFANPIKTFEVPMICLERTA